MMVHPQQAARATCERCDADVLTGAAYCASCGQRTPRARRLVRLAIRVELLFIVLVLLLVFGFAFVFYAQH